MGMLSRATRGSTEMKKVKIPEGTVEALKEIGRIRGVDWELIVQIQLNAYINAFERTKILDVDSVINFGKYRGNTVETVIRVDPGYWRYLISEETSYKLSERAVELLESMP